MSTTRRSTVELAPRFEHSSVLAFPDELLISILQLLEPRDILRVRQCCSRLYAVTYDITLWKAVAAHLSRTLPLPSIDCVRSFNLTDLEQACIRAVHVARCWLIPRELPPRKISLLCDNRRADYFQVCDNRFAVAIYAEIRTVSLWDLDGLQVRGSKTHHAWGRIVGKWTFTEGTIALTTCNARFCESTQEIFVSFFLMFSASHDEHGRITLLSISTFGNPARERSFQQMDIALKEVLPLSESEMIGLNPEMKCVAHCSSRSEMVTLTNWKTGLSNVLSAPKNTFDEEDNWNNMLCVEIFEPYVIIVKQNLLILYLIPADLEHQAHSSKISAQVQLVWVLSDVFHTVSLRLQETTDNMLKFVLAASNPFKSVLYYQLCLPRDPSAAFSWQLYLVYLDECLAARGVFVRSGVSLGSRGTRAVWIEKARQNMERNVVVLMADKTRVDPITGIYATSKAIIFQTSSPDFNDDPTHIFCDEVTGRIVLATRGGQLWVLDCWQKPIIKRKPLARFQNHRGI